MVILAISATSSYPPPDRNCSRRAIEVGVARKVLVETDLRGGRGEGGRSRRKHHEAIEVEGAFEMKFNNPNLTRWRNQDSTFGDNSRNSPNSQNDQNIQNISYGHSMYNNLKI